MRMPFGSNDNCTKETTLSLFPHYIKLAAKQKASLRLQLISNTGRKRVQETHPLFVICTQREVPKIVIRAIIDLLAFC